MKKLYLPGALFCALCFLNCGGDAGETNAGDGVMTLMLSDYDGNALEGVNVVIAEADGFTFYNSCTTSADGIGNIGCVLTGLPVDKELSVMADFGDELKVWDVTIPADQPDYTFYAFIEEAME
jgi:hypothetical protein